jgi:mannosyltransferase OCH1-like enzyme
MPLDVAKHIFVLIFSDVDFIAIPVHHGIPRIVHQVREAQNIPEKCDFCDAICDV